MIAKALKHGLAVAGLTLLSYFPLQAEESFSGKVKAHSTTQLFTDHPKESIEDTIVQAGKVVVEGTLDLDKIRFHGEGHVGGISLDAFLPEEAYGLEAEGVQASLQEAFVEGDVSSATFKAGMFEDTMKRPLYADSTALYTVPRAGVALEAVLGDFKLGLQHFLDEGLPDRPATQTTSAQASTTQKTSAGVFKLLGGLHYSPDVEGKTFTECEGGVTFLPEAFKTALFGPVALGAYACHNTENGATSTLFKAALPSIPVTENTTLSIFGVYAPSLEADSSVPDFRPKNLPPLGVRDAFLVGAKLKRGKWEVSYLHLEADLPTGFRAKNNLLNVSYDLLTF